MKVSIRSPELFGMTEESVVLAFDVVDDAGRPVDARVRVRVGDVLALSEGGGATRIVRVPGLRPDTGYAIHIEVEGGAGAEPDRHFPGTVHTLPAPTASCVASFATLNDLHFGEPRFGGTLLPDGDYGDEAPGFAAVHATDTEVPYWQFMNEDAVAEINELGVDAAIVKGDIADRGRPEQFEAAARTFAGFAMPHHAFLGNHDYYGRHEGLSVDGYALLGQPPAPRSVELAGWRLVLLETTEPGEHHGVFPEERLHWLEEELESTREGRIPTLLFMHHQPVPPQFLDRFPNRIGMRPEHSIPLLELIGGHPQVRGVLIGHTHRNRVRRYPESGAAPFVEVQCTKDYPGGFGHYRLFEDGTFRQEVRRTASARALAHATRCRDLFDGGYRSFALGRLEDRSFVARIP